MNLFLRAKHWHIFIVIFALPQIMQVVWMNLVFVHVASMHERSTQDPEAILGEFLSMMPSFILVFAFISFVQFGWYISVALGLRKYTPEAVRLNTASFWFAITLVALITLGILAGMAYVFQGIEGMFFCDAIKIFISIYGSGFFFCLCHVLSTVLYRESL